MPKNSLKYFLIKVYSIFYYYGNNKVPKFSSQNLEKMSKDILDKQYESFLLDRFNNEKNVVPKHFKIASIKYFTELLFLFSQIKIQI